MLGHYTFLYQLEILQEEAEIPKLKNITLLSISIAPTYQKGKLQRCFPLFIYLRCQLLPMCVSYPEGLCRASVVEGPSLYSETVGPMPCTEVQVEVYVQRGMWPFFQCASINIKIINIFSLAFRPPQLF